MHEMHYAFKYSAESEFRRTAKAEYYMAMYGSASGERTMQDFASMYIMGGPL